MIEYDYEAIFKAHPNVAVISDDEGVWDKNENKVELDPVKIAAARVELDKLKYRTQRAEAYPTIQEQLDMQYWDKKNGTTTWVDAITKVKTDYPKP